jgi:uncharacterized MnhB-related membrane protein
MALVLSLLAWITCVVLSHYYPMLAWVLFAPLIALGVAVVGGGLWCLLYWAWTGEAPIRDSPL